MLHKATDGGVRWKIFDATTAIEGKSKKSSAGQRGRLPGLDPSVPTVGDPGALPSAAPRDRFSASPCRPEISAEVQGNTFYSITNFMS